MCEQNTKTEERNMKKFTALFLALLMCMSLLSVGAFADEAPVTGTCGENVTWSLHNGQLDIRGTGPMDDIPNLGAEQNKLAQPWHDYASSIKFVSIGFGVTTVGNYAFFDCDSIEAVIINEGVTSIGVGSFSSCDKLYVLSIGGDVKSIGNVAFQSCTALTNVTVPDSVTFIDAHAFQNCTKLQNLTLSKNLENIKLETFAGCSSLETVTLPDSVKAIGMKAFDGCTKLASINFPAGLESIGSYAFNECNALKNITLGSNLKSVGHHAFEDTGYYNDNKNWEGTKDDGILYIGEYLITSHSSEPEITVKDGTKIICEMAFDELVNKFEYPNVNLESVIIPDSVTTIESLAFADCRNLKSVAMGNGVATIGSSAFENCEKLANVTIPESVTSIGYEAFGGCKALSRAKFMGNAPEVFEKDVFKNTASGFKILAPKDDSTWKGSAYNSFMRTWNGYSIEFYGDGGSSNPFSFITDLLDSIMNIFRNLFSWLPFFG